MGARTAPTRALCVQAQVWAQPRTGTRAWGQGPTGALCAPCSRCPSHLTSPTSVVKAYPSTEQSSGGQRTGSLTGGGAMGTFLFRGLAWKPRRGSLARLVPPEPHQVQCRAGRLAARVCWLETAWGPAPAGTHPHLNQLPAGPGPDGRQSGGDSLGLAGCRAHPSRPPHQVSASPGRRSSTCPPSPEQVAVWPQPRGPLSPHFPSTAMPCRDQA